MIKQLNKFTKTVLIIGIILIFYGYLCRLIGLYFFWESKSIGWVFLLIGLIGILSNSIKIKKLEKRKILFEKIGIGIVVFMMLVQTILIVIIPLTDAYSTAKTYLNNDIEINDEVGEIIGFGFIPTGGIQKTTDSNGEFGSATINITVKGEKKFKDITIYVIKNVDSPNWKVEGIE